MIGGKKSYRGPSYGYFPNANKPWLIIKDSAEADAKLLFKDAGIKITFRGQPYLGSRDSRKPWLYRRIHSLKDLSLDHCHWQSDWSSKVPTSPNLMWRTLPTLTVFLISDLLWAVPPLNMYMRTITAVGWHHPKPTYSHLNRSSHT